MQGSDGDLFLDHSKILAIAESSIADALGAVESMIADLVLENLTMMVRWRRLLEKIWLWFLDITPCDLAGLIHSMAVLTCEMTVMKTEIYRVMVSQRKILKYLLLEKRRINLTLRTLRAVPS